MESYVPLLLMGALAVVVAGGMFVLTSIAGKKNKTPEKMTAFECGWPSAGAQGIRLSVKFYLTAILFVVFDVETVFLFPWAVRFRDLGWIGFVSMVAFLAVFAIAIVYVWRKGALEWER